MDTSKYIKECPRCHTDIEPSRYATGFDKAMAGTTGVGGAAIGLALFGPIGGIIGGILGYRGGKKAMLSIEDDHEEDQWFKYKCPHCGCEWKEEIHTNDNPQDTTWLTHMY